MQTRISKELSDNEILIQLFPIDMMQIDGKVNHNNVSCGEELPSCTLQPPVNHSLETFTVQIPSSLHNGTNYVLIDHCTTFGSQNKATRSLQRQDLGNKTLARSQGKQAPFPQHFPNLSSHTPFQFSCESQWLFFFIKHYSSSNTLWKFLTEKSPLGGEYPANNVLSLDLSCFKHFMKLL